MTTIRATVSTTRATRYLAQLCSHTGHFGSRLLHRRTHGASARHVEHTAQTPTSEAVTDTSGRIRLGDARCDLTAGPTALTLVVTAEDPEQARSLQTAVTRTLERIGRRDELSVTWEDADD